jgi:anti-sigma regulatory factor (Ser/Thr protein kinase)
VGTDAVAQGDDSVMPRPAPPQASLALIGGTSDIALARHEAACFLAETGVARGEPVSTRALDVTQLVVSELVTNALKYAVGPVLLALRIVDDRLEVELWDSDPVLPVARAADVGRVGQHGLEIVMALVDTFEVRREPVGKRITVRIALHATPQEGSIRRTS